MRIAKNRKEVLNVLKNPAKARNVIYISPRNTLTHELAKTTFFYYLKKGYSADNIEYLFNYLISKKLVELENEITEMINRFKFKRKYGELLLLTEAELDRYKVDLLIADTKRVIEFDHKHKTRLRKYKKLKELFDVSVISI